MRWRSAVVSFGGLGAIVSLPGEIAWGVADPFGEGAAVAVGCSWGVEDAGPMSQFVRLVDADFPCAPPSNPKVWSNR